MDFRIFSQASLVGGLLYAAAAITAVSLGLRNLYASTCLYRTANSHHHTHRLEARLPTHYTVRGAIQFSIPPELRRRILRYSRDIVLIFATSTIPYERFGIFFLNRFATDVDIAFYSQSFDLAIRAMAIPAIFTATLLPTPFPRCKGRTIANESTESIFLPIESWRQSPCPSGWEALRSRRRSRSCTVLNSWQ